MKSIQEEIERILDKEIDYGYKWQMSDVAHSTEQEKEFEVEGRKQVRKAVKAISELFKTKWLEMLEDEEDSSDEKAFPEGGSDHSFVRNQLRKELRQQISKEEI